MLLQLLQANGQPFSTRIYTVNDGLPDSYTLGAMQDHQGYLWVYTLTGLCRFDGQRFVTVNQKTSSVTNTGNIVLQDREDRIWIVHNKSVGIFKTDTVITFPTNDNLPMNYVFGAVQLSNGKIWALIDSGAYEFTGNNWQRIQFPGKYKNLDCRQVIETPEGLYINFAKAIVLKKKDGTYQEIAGEPWDKTFYVSLRIANNKIYANTNSGIARIENGKAIPVFTEQLRGNTNYYFIIDSRGRFWVSTEKKGLLVSKPNDDSKLEYEIKLPLNLTTFIMEDVDKNIWATNYEGLIKIKDVPFTSYTGSDDPMFDNGRFITTDNSGSVYFASSTKGINRYNYQSQSFEHINFSGVKNFNSEVVDGIAFTPGNEMWLITRNRKLFKYNSGSITDLTSKFNNVAEYFVSIVPYGNNEVMLASDSLYIGNEKGFISWQQSFRTTEMMHPRFICKRKNGSFIISAVNAGVFLANADGTITNISKQINVQHDYRYVRAWEDPDGGIWFSNSNNGISKFKETSAGKFEREVTVGIIDGLPNNMITSATFDKNNNLWLSTLSGLAVISKKNNGYSIQRVAEELNRTIVNWNAASITCDKENTVWVCTLHELVKIDASSISSAPEKLWINIEKIKLGFKNENFKTYSDSLTAYFNIPHNPTFNYKENTIEISFQGISYTSRNRLLYSYKLLSSESFSEDDTESWSEPSGNNSVSFVRLPHGKYVFAVKVKEAGSDWSKPALFSFTINPPVWTRWWFRALLIIVSASIIWLLVRYRIKSVQKKSEIQKQLHQLEMKALKAQMNPHFIYNALNSIQSLVANDKQQEALKYISKFAKLLRQVLEHSGSNLVSLDKELNTLELYVQLEMLRMNMKLDYSVIVDEQVLTEKEWVPPLILQPFIENALWHGLNRKEGEKKLMVNISSDDEWIYATIIDNGIGRKKASELKASNTDYPRSMGMDITSKRLQLVNENKEMFFTINDLTDQNGNPAGTEIKISIKRHSAPANTDKA